ncbi:MAG: metallophosphoesterase family protein, partial [Acidaminococcaceae bacterium]|nr:metallophosphoesterase family protein [Acidaminococcaceae bacterium]
MKIGIISDTHGSMAAIRKVLATAPPVECWIHCGDYAMDANALHNMINQTVYAVSGNCDVMRGPVEAKPDCFLEIEGFKLWVTHGHLYMGETRQI